MTEKHSSSDESDLEIVILILPEWYPFYPHRPYSIYTRFLQTAHEENLELNFKTLTSGLLGCFLNKRDQFHSVYQIEVFTLLCV